MTGFEPQSDRHSSRTHAAILLVSIAAMLWISWRKWAHVSMDFGREVYVPWRLSAGELLYRDVHHIYGPLSDYLNALLFGVFGTGIMTLAVFNIFLICILTFLIYDFFHKTMDRTTGLFTSLTFVTALAFSQNSLAPGFNFVCPYCYELPHGVMLSMLSMWVLMRYVANGRRTLVGVIGFLSGLVFLTKAEVFFAYAVSMALALFVLFRTRKIDLKEAGILLFGGSLFFLMPVAGFGVYFAERMGTAEALRTLVFPYAIFFNPAVMDVSRLYADIMGIASPLKLIDYSFKALAVYGIILAALVGTDRMFQREMKRENAVKFLICAAAFCAGFLYLKNTKVWQEIWLFPAPYILIFFIAMLGVQLSKTDPSDEAYGRIFPLTVFAVFAFLLLFKIFFRVTIHYYGFALAMPATLMVVAFFSYFVPTTAVKFNRPQLVRAVILILISLALGFYVDNSYRVYKLKTLPVGEGRDLMWTHQSKLAMGDVILERTLAVINGTMGPNDTFVVFPEGAMLNYLSRRINPTPYYQNVPLEFSLYDEAKVIRTLESTSPDYIIIITRDTAMYGLPYFGKDYGVRTYAWINDHYVPKYQIGNPSYLLKEPGAWILKKKKK